MDLTINCKISLSKRLRSLLGKEGTVTLVTSSLIDGKGMGKLSLSNEGADISGAFNPEAMPETAIMIEPVDMVDEVPNNDTQVHASIFATMQTEASSKSDEEPVVQKIAVVTPPEKGEESRAIKKEISTPQEFSKLDESECKEWIADFEGLIEAVRVSRQKQSTIDLESARDDREYAVLKEQKDKEEAIDIPAWIVNDKAGALTINDLDISLPLNSPFDLSRIPARKISASKDLKSLLKSGYVKFVSPDERESYISKITEKEEEKVSELEVFDNHIQAGASMEGVVDTTINEEDNLMITENDMDTLSDEESMIMDLTQNMPTTKAITSSSKTVHSNRSPQSVQSAQSNSPNIKRIRKVN